MLTILPRSKLPTPDERELTITVHVVVKKVHLSLLKNELRKISSIRIIKTKFEEKRYRLN
jgi:hypothetical protein